MSPAAPTGPRTVSGGLVLVDPDSAQILRVVALQYNPDTLTRTLQVQGAGAESGDRVDVLRLKGAPVETIKLEAELDAADQLETATDGSRVAEYGLHAELAALETCVYPRSADVRTNQALAAVGTLEIIPPQTPLVLFTWGAKRIVPVRITELSVTEEAFNPALNPLRARVQLGLRVLGTNDVPRGHLAASLAMSHHQALERRAALATGVLAALGLERLP